MQACTGLKKPAAVLTIMLVLLSFLRVSMGVVSSDDTGRKIDLFTQKVPFNGKGINQSSDAFEPQALVILYANVTYNEAPILNKPVAFYASNPPNAFQNITAVGTSFTNESGIAEFSFRIPWPPESPEWTVFGVWSAVASVDIAEQVVVDVLTFQVGWIVKITNVATLNANLKPQTKYLRGEAIIFDVTVRNIALTVRSGTVAISAQDAYGHPIIYVEMDDLVFQPGDNHLRAYSQIPITAVIGEARVSTSAYTAPPGIGGVLYSPEYVTTFEIIEAPIPSEKHDVAVTSVGVSTSRTYVGTSIEIAVEVANLGWFTETFNTSVYYESIRISTKKVSSLGSGLNTALTFTWDTVSMKAGNYTVWAFAEYVPEEVNVANNILADGNVTLLPRPTVEMHDIAVSGVFPSRTAVYLGEIVDINVVVENEGTYFESFTVAALHDHVIIERIIVSSLAPGSEKTLVFHWNTQSMMEGNYTLSAEASTVPGEVDIENNRFVDGVVWVRSWMLSAMRGLLGWVLILLFISTIIGALLLFVIAFALLRRRRKRSQDNMDTQLNCSRVKPFSKTKSKRGKRCSTCGKEFPSVYTFCPYCFTFYGKDYE